MNLTKQDIFVGFKEPYLRPFLCKGDVRKAKVMLIGINPASPIYPSEIESNEYLDLCMNYDRFMDYYKKNRRKNGKSEMSRTRVGITAFVEWINSSLNTDVVETDICTYPTSSYQDLKIVSEEVMRKGQELFWKVFWNASACEIAVLYGEITLKWFIESVESRGIKSHIINDFGGEIKHIQDFLQYSIKEIEKSSPIFDVYLQNKQIRVFVARHLMYYGKHGNSYAMLRKSISEYWENNRKHDARHL